jgi:hypothetical protein
MPFIIAVKGLHDKICKIMNGLGLGEVQGTRDKYKVICVHDYLSLRHGFAKAISNSDIPVFILCTSSVTHAKFIRDNIPIAVRRQSVLIIDEVRALFPMQPRQDSNRVGQRPRMQKKCSLIWMELLLGVPEADTQHLQCIGFKHLILCDGTDFDVPFLIRELRKRVPNITWRRLVQDMAKLRARGHAGIDNMNLFESGITRDDRHGVGINNFSVDPQSKNKLDIFDQRHMFGRDPFLLAKKTGDNVPRADRIPLTSWAPKLRKFFSNFLSTARRTQQRCVLLEATAYTVTKSDAHIVNLAMNTAFNFPGVIATYLCGGSDTGIINIVSYTDDTFSYDEFEGSFEDFMDSPKIDELSADRGNVICPVYFITNMAAGSQTFNNGTGLWRITHVYMRSYSNGPIGTKMQILGRASVNSSIRIPVMVLTDEKLFKNDIPKVSGLCEKLYDHVDKVHDDHFYRLCLYKDEARLLRSYHFGHMANKLFKKAGTNSVKRDRRPNEQPNHVPNVPFQHGDSVSDSEDSIIIEDTSSINEGYDSDADFNADKDDEPEYNSNIDTDEEEEEDPENWSDLGM